jgi:hypothetical protein
METAPVRQPRVRSEWPRRAIGITLGVAAASLVAGAVLLQPFTATHMLPSRTGSPPAAASEALPPVTAIPPPSPAPAAVAAPASTAAPVTLVAPRRPIPTTAVGGDAIEPPVATSGSVPSAGTREPATIVVAPAAALPSLPESRSPIAAPAPAGRPATLAVAPATAAPPRGRQPTAAAASAAAVAAPAEPPHGPPPPPREPLPLQTDLIAPGSPEPTQTARPDATPGMMPSVLPDGSKPTAADRHG